MNNETFEMKVSASADVKGLASSLFQKTDDGYTQYDLLCIGAASINQCMKGIAAARGLFIPTNRDLYVQPSFSKVLTSDNEEKTALKIHVEVRDNV